MIIMVYAAASRDTIAARLGTPQYSYFFAMQDFLPIIDRLGTLVPLQEPRREADGVYERSRQAGQGCVFLSFAPPHLTAHDLACSTIAVFPIEYEDLPTERRNGDGRHDWRWVLRRLDRAITHSSHACAVVRKAMGAAFPVTDIPSPVWDRFAGLRRRTDGPPGAAPFALTGQGDVVDSRIFQPARPVAPAALSASAAFTFDPGRLIGTPRRLQRATIEVRLAGIVYSTIFNSRDDRKNWRDIVRAFCRALPGQADATLLLKVIHKGDPDFRYALIQELGRLSPFDCRVVMTDAFLDDQSYGALIRNSTYVVNASSAEGQCLPLMEAMSAGVPAVAPSHTALVDYVDASNAFLVGTTREPAAWPDGEAGASDRLP